jgi:hypothetical protein
MRHYEINIGGYGAEVCWKSITREQYDFWNSVDKEELDRHILGPCSLDDDDREGGLDENNVPDFAKLKANPDDEWYDMDDVAHEYYCSLGSAWFTVTEIKEGENGERLREDVVVFDDLRSEARQRGLDMFVHNEQTEHLEDGKQYLQVFSSEKGTFVTTVVALDDSQEFDITKVKIRVCESLNERDDMIESVEYGGIELENDGAETRGKGIDVYLVDYID